MDRSRFVGVVRTVAGFAAFFAGTALQALGRSISDKVDEFADELEEAAADDGERSAETEADGGEVVGSATLSDVARRMVLEGSRTSCSSKVSRDEPESPLAGSLRARFARGA